MSDVKSSGVKRQKTFTVFCQQWEESERGWGVRPDGFSLHLTQKDLKKYIKRHDDILPDDHVPDEYTRVSGEPYKCRIGLKTYEELQKNKKSRGSGLGFHGNSPTPVGGWDKLEAGWKPISSYPNTLALQRS